MLELLRDVDYREALAEAAYLKERRDEAAIDAEHDLGDSAYYCLAWGYLSDTARRPYRAAVAVALDQVADLHD